MSVSDVQQKTGATIEELKRDQSNGLYCQYRPSWKGAVLANARNCSLDRLDTYAV